MNFQRSNLRTFTTGASADTTPLSALLWPSGSCAGCRNRRRVLPAPMPAKWQHAAKGSSANWRTALATLVATMASDPATALRNVEKALDATVGERLSANLLRQASLSLTELQRLVADPRTPVATRASICLKLVKIALLSEYAHSPKRHAHLHRHVDADSGLREAAKAAQRPYSPGLLVSGSGSRAKGTLDGKCG